MSGRWRDLRDRVVGGLARLTARERALGACLVCVALVWGAMQAWTAADAARAALADVRGMQRADAAPASDRGDARNARAWSIAAPSANIARVRALTLVEQAAGQAGVADARATIDDARPGNEGVERIEIGLTGAYGDRSFAALLSALGAGEQSLTPTEIDVDRTRGRFRMVVVGLYLREAAT